jgi:DNA-binding NtrC family response regulator
VNANSSPAPELQPKTILLVEDEVLIRLHIAKYLRECGYQVIEAISADEALVVLQSEYKVDLVLSDVQMPGSLDGFGLAQWVRKNMNGLPVILCGTPKRAADTAAELCEDGPTMAKPYEPQALADLIRRHLGLTSTR